MKAFLSIFNRSLLLYFLIAAVTYFLTNADIVQKQRIKHLGNCLYDNKGEMDYKTATVYYEYLTLRNLANADNWASLGACQVYLGELKEAAASYKKAITLNKHNIEYIQNFIQIEKLLKKK